MNSKLLTNSTLNHGGFLRLPQILSLIPIGASSWWRWCAEGRAPKGIKISPKTTVWRSEDIANLIEKLAKEGQV